MTYAGDAHLVLKTKVQANPLNHKQPDIHLMTGSRGMLAAKDSLVVPMLLRLSHFRLSSYVVLVVSKQKGITLVFKTDPLQNVDINSTFDSIAVIQNFIQREIEGQLRQMFREDLPGIIHRLSQQWVKTKVEAPYLDKRPPPPPTRHTFDTIQQKPNIADIGLHSHYLRRPYVNSLPSRRPSSISGSSIASATRHSTLKSPSPASHPETPSSSPSSSSHPDLENFDPTYGLRPEGLPSKSGFKGFSSLFTPNKGLADLAEKSSDFSEYGDEDDERGSFDLVDWHDTIQGTSSVYNDSHHESPPEYAYETIPRRSISADLMDYRDDEEEDERSVIYMKRPPFERRLSVTSSTSNLDSRTSSPPSDRYRQLRHHSLSQSSSPSYPHSFHSLHQQDPANIVLRLSLNNSIHQLSTLSHSNHTLSPYTRDVSHFTVRSVPPRGVGHGHGFTGGQGQGLERQPSVKAKRKRIYRLGGGPVVVDPPAATAVAALPRDTDYFSPQHNDSILPSEFDVSDMDKYFRSYDSDPSRSPNLTPTITAATTGTVRRRTKLG